MKLVRTFLAVMLVFAPANLLAADSQADLAFQKLKSLAGEWEGKDQDGMAATTKFEVTAGGTAVVEILKMGGMEEMLTVYSVDGKGIALVHYCPTNNQPRMKAIPAPGDLQHMELDFVFRDAGNMPVATTGHQQRLVLKVGDANSITENWTWRANGQDSVQTIKFTRKAKAGN